MRLIGDVKDLAHLRQTFATWKPQVVFHAAAYKHVPLMEEHNAFAALANNTIGTWHAALAAAEAGAERFVLISTDKAVNPTNVMGASKRAAEMAVSALARQHPATRFITVRFGNVLGSSGSVIPKFKEQIARGGPVTVTDDTVFEGNETVILTIAAAPAYTVGGANTATVTIADNEVGVGVAATTANTLGVLRYKQNIGRESSVGMRWTNAVLHHTPLASSPAT